MTATRRIWTTIQMIPGRRAAMIESHDQSGQWLGSGLVELPSFSAHTHPGADEPWAQLRDALYEVGYKLASVNAAAHGGQLDRYRWA